MIERDGNQKRENLNPISKMVYTKPVYCGLAFCSNNELLRVIIYIVINYELCYSITFFYFLHVIFNFLLLNQMN